MARIAASQKTWARGILSEKLWDRSDLELYYSALQTCKNYVIDGRGMQEKRPGTHHVKPTKNNGFAMLVAFGHTASLSYMMEFGDQYIRAYANHGPVMDGLNHSEIASPYLLADLHKLSRAQSTGFDRTGELFIAHDNYPTKYLKRLTPNTFSLTDLTTFDGPYLDINGNGAWLLSVAAGGIITATGFAPFVPGDVGRWIRIRYENPTPPTDPDLEDLYLWGFAQISAYTSPTQVTAANLDPTLVVPATPTWRLGAFFQGNYPSAVAFHQNRLVLAKGDRIYFSRPYTSIDFSPTAVPAGNTATDYVLPSSSITAVIEPAIDQNGIISTVYWMRTLDFQLVIGTPIGIVTLQASALGEGLQPGNVTSRWQDSRGVSTVQPVAVADSLIFAHITGKRLQGTYYKNTSQVRLGAQDLSLPADTLMTDSIRQIAWQDYPHGIVWQCLEDGSWQGLTLQPEEQVQAWHEHVPGGRLIDNGRVLPAGVESVATMPSPDGKMSDLWIITHRTINGVPARHVEFMHPYWEKGTDARDAWYLDDATAYTGNDDIAKTLTFTAGAPDTDWPVISNFTSPAFSLQQKLSFYDGARWHRGTVVSLFGTNDFMFRPAAPNAPAAPADGLRWFYTGADGDTLTSKAGVVLTSKSGVALTGKPVLWVQQPEEYFDGSMANIYEGPKQTANIWRWSIAQDDFSGLAYLEGEKVQGLLDGTPSLLFEVDAGSVNFGSEASVVCAGLRYESAGALLSLTVGAQAGEAKGKQGPVYSREISIWESGGIEIGTGKISSYYRTWAHYQPLPMPGVPSIEGEPPLLSSGLFSLGSDEQWSNTDAQVGWRHRDPLPSFVRSVLVRMNRSDGK